MKVKFIKQIHGNFASASSSDVYVERTFELPFLPVVGMEFSQGDWNCTVTEISYDGDKQEVHAYTEEDKELYDAGLKSARPFEWRDLPSWSEKVANQRRETDLLRERRISNTQRLREIVESYVKDGWEERKKK